MISTLRFQPASAADVQDANDHRRHLRYARLSPRGTAVAARGRRSLHPLSSRIVLHAGDVNTSGVLLALSEIAPVLAVRGNNDDAILMENLPETVEFSIGRPPVRDGPWPRRVVGSERGKAAVCGTSRLRHLRPQSHPADRAGKRHDPIQPRIGHRSPLGTALRCRA